MIELKNVSFSFENGKELFRDLSLSIPDTGITAIIAPSGTGKTTLLRLICGLCKPTSGQITGVPERVPYVFQEERLLPWSSALQNVAVANPSRQISDAIDILTELGVSEEVMAKLPPKLSGGEKRRISLARAFFFDGDMLLLDEPFTGLDEANRNLVLKKVKEYAKTKPVVLVSHIKEDIEVADKVIRLKRVY